MPTPIGFEQLKDFPAKAVPVGADILYGGNSASSFAEVKILISGIVIGENQVTNLVNDLAAKFPFSGGQFNGEVQAFGNPVNPLDIVPKQYADAIGNGLRPYVDVFAATTVNLNATYANGASGVGATLTDASGTFAALNIDATPVPLNGRFLVKNQTTGFQNGSYLLTTQGDGISVPWQGTRTTDFNQASNILQYALFGIINGGTQSNEEWYMTTASPVTVGTTALVFAQYTGQIFTLKAANNLSDVSSAATSRTNLHVPATSTFAGNPNGSVAGAVGDFVVDTTDANELWMCTTAGNAASAVWTLQTTLPSPFTFGAGAGSAIGGDGSSTSAGADDISFGSGTSVLSGATFCINVGQNNTISGSGFASAIFGGSNSSNGSYTFIAGQGCTANVSNGVAFGVNSNIQFNGSAIFSDATGGSPKSDTAANQLVLNYNGGIYIYGGSSNGTLIANIGGLNWITHKGTADQSYSLQIPSTGFSITIAAGVKTLELSPAGTLATGTIIMPAAPIDGQEIRVSSTQTITALTVSPNSGQTFPNAPTTLAAGQGFSILYNLANTQWLVLYQPASGGGSPLTAGAGTNSAFGGGGLNANGNNALVWGLNSTGDGTYAIALGDHCVASNTGTTAIGFNCLASGSIATAIGYNATASGAHSIAIGLCTASSSGSFVAADDANNGFSNSANQQWLTSFTGGYLTYVGTTLATSIDTSGNFFPVIGTLGVTDASNAVTGNVGEVIQSIIAFGSAVSFTTGTATDVTSIALTAGDWDVYGNVTYVVGGICTVLIGWVSATSATLPDASLYAETSTAAGLSNCGFQVPYKRINVSTTTTVYLSGYTSFSTSTVVACGGIFARRVR